MKGPSSTYICLLLSFPSFLAPLSQRSAPTSRLRLSPFSSGSKMAADKWLAGCLTGLILDHEVCSENDPRSRRDRRRCFGRTRPRARSHLSDGYLSPSLPLFLSSSLSLPLPLAHPLVRFENHEPPRTVLFRYRPRERRRFARRFDSYTAYLFGVIRRNFSERFPECAPRARAIDDQSRRRDGDVARYIRRTPTPTLLLLSL